MKLAWSGYHFPDDKTLYHMGDTDIFGDMALIQELHQPDIGIVPSAIGLPWVALSLRSPAAAISTSTKRSLATTGASLSSIRRRRVEGLKGSSTEAVVPKIGKTISV